MSTDWPERHYCCHVIGPQKEDKVTAEREHHMMSGAGTSPSRTPYTEQTPGDVIHAGLMCSIKYTWVCGSIFTLQVSVCANSNSVTAVSKRV